MKGATWNIRGLNKRGKLQCITDFINDNKLDFVIFQETKKKSPLLTLSFHMQIKILIGTAFLPLAL
jgi:exonuclease III